MNGPFADEYWQDACNELETLKVMVAWNVVDLEDNMHVIISTWYFKLK